MRHIHIFHQHKVSVSQTVIKTNEIEGTSHVRHTLHINHENKVTLSLKRLHDESHWIHSTLVTSLFNFKWLYLMVFD